jgi:hypothetical protein
MLIPKDLRPRKLLDDAALFLIIRKRLREN